MLSSTSATLPDASRTRSRHALASSPARSQPHEGRRRVELSRPGGWRHGSRRPEEQHGAGLEGAREPQEALLAFRSREVEVLEHQDERALGGERAEQPDRGRLEGERTRLERDVAVEGPGEHVGERRQRAEQLAQPRTLTRRRRPARGRRRRARHPPRPPRRDRASPRARAGRRGPAARPATPARGGSSPSPRRPRAAGTVPPRRRPRPTHVPAWPTPPRRPWKRVARSIGPSRDAAGGARRAVLPPPGPALAGHERVAQERRRRGTDAPAPRRAAWRPRRRRTARAGARRRAVTWRRAGARRVAAIPRPARAPGADRSRARTGRRPARRGPSADPAPPPAAAPAPRRGGIPRTAPVPESRAARSCRTATPRSASFTCSSAVMTTFSGFTSRWTRPAAWTAASASATRAPMWRQRRSGTTSTSRSSARRFCPSTYSRTRYGTSSPCASSSPVERVRTTFG